MISETLTSGARPPIETMSSRFACVSLGLVPTSEIKPSTNKQISTPSGNLQMHVKLPFSSIRLQKREECLSSRTHPFPRNVPKISAHLPSHYVISCQIKPSVPVLSRLVNRLVISRHATDVHQWLSGLSRDITSHIPLSQALVHYIASFIGSSRLTESTLGSSEALASFQMSSFH